MSKFNPAWWAFYGLGKVALKGVEWLDDHFAHDDEEDEDVDDLEDELEETEDDKDNEDEEEEDGSFGDLEDRLEPAPFELNTWWEEEKQRFPDDKEDEDEEPVEEPEEETEDERPLHSFSRWVERKANQVVGNAARLGFRMLAQTDFGAETPEFEIPYPSWLHCYIPGDDEDYEAVDEMGMPFEPVERGFDSVDDLITPPHLDEDEEIENSDYEEEDEPED